MDSCFLAESAHGREGDHKFSDISSYKGTNVIPGPAFMTLSINDYLPKAPGSKYDYIGIIVCIWVWRETVPSVTQGEGG